jgi:tRNA(fMet)-specific endonuclease VapC
VRRYLLETKPAQDFNQNRHGVRQRADVERRRGNRIGICMPVLGELWAGIEGSETREENLRRLRHGLSRLLLWPYNEAAAAEYGRVFTDLKRMGRPMQQVDIQIAAIAFALGNCTVVSADSDLAAVPGLTVEDWTV